jgi:hypothetical protein
MDVMVLAYIVAIAVSFGVGIPVLVRSWRHRDGRLALLGGVVTVDGFEWLAWGVAVFSSASGTPLGDALGIVSRVGIAVSVLCMIAFTRLAFRPAGSAPGVVCGLLVGALLGGFLGGGLSGDWVGVNTDLVWLWLEQFTIALAYGWGALEALRFHLLMRRRVVHGLAEPLVANRFLLWGLYAGGFCVAQLIYCVSLAFYGAVSNMDVLNAAVVVGAEVAFFLAVFPPAWYARRVSAAASAAV